jgi:hypothetical protein
VGEKIDQVKVLKKEGTVKTRSLDLIRVRDGNTV